VGKHAINVGVKQGTCVGCHSRFIGPGDRCPDCARDLRAKTAKRSRGKRNRG
jgi:hypothetical protein